MPNQSLVRILVADDHFVVREGLKAIFNQISGFVVVAEAESGEEAISRYKEFLPDVCVIDLFLPDSPGVEVISEIKKINRSAGILVLTFSDGDELARQAIENGALGFLLKGAPGREVIDAVRRVAVGQRYITEEVRNLLHHRATPKFTPREIAVLKLLARGKKNLEIANELLIAENTVKVHIQSIMGKLEARDRTEAALIALKRGLTSL